MAHGLIKTNLSNTSPAEARRTPLALRAGQRHAVSSGPIVEHESTIQRTKTTIQRASSAACSTVRSTTVFESFAHLDDGRSNPCFDSLDPNNSFDSCGFTKSLLDTGQFQMCRSAIRNRPPVASCDWQSLWHDRLTA